MVPITPVEYRVIEDVLHARYPRVHGMLRDELISAGHLGLTHAALEYDHQHGMAFRSYAWALVRYAMQDELRRQDHLTRGQREAVTNGQATDPGPPIPMDAHQIATRFQDTDDQHANTEARLDATHQVEHALNDLPPREQAIIRCEDLHGWSRQDVAQALGVTTSQISRLRTRALKRMRVAIHDHEIAA